MKDEINEWAGDVEGEGGEEEEEEEAEEEEVGVEGSDNGCKLVFKYWENWRVEEVIRPAFQSSMTTLAAASNPCPPTFFPYSSFHVWVILSTCAPLL